MASNLKCSDLGKHGGEVKRRRVLRHDGEYLTSTYQGAKCDTHWKRDLRNAVKRGRKAEEILARAAAATRRP